MTLVKSLHSDDPKVIQNTWTCKYPIIQGKELASTVWVKSIKGLLPLGLHSSLSSRYKSICNGHMHWGSHVKVPQIAIK